MNESWVTSREINMNPVEGDTCLEGVLLHDISSVNRHRSLPSDLEFVMFQVNISVNHKRPIQAFPILRSGNLKGHSLTSQTWTKQQSPSRQKQLGSIRSMKRLANGNSGLGMGGIVGNVGSYIATFWLDLTLIWLDLMLCSDWLIFVATCWSNLSDTNPRSIPCKSLTPCVFFLRRCVFSSQLQEGCASLHDRSHYHAKLANLVEGWSDGWEIRRFIDDEFMFSGGQESTQKMGFVGRCIGGLYFDMFTSNHFSIHDMFTWWSWAAPCLMPRNSKKLAGGLCLFGTSSTFDAEVGSEAATTNRWSSRVLGAVLHSGRGEQWGRQWHVFFDGSTALVFCKLILSIDTWELLRICGCLCNSELFWKFQISCFRSFLKSWRTRIFNTSH